MAADFATGLAGLSVLTGTNQFAGYAAPVTVESRAVRRAKAQFTAQPLATPPWKLPAPKSPLAQQVSATLALRSLVERPPAGLAGARRDEQTSIAAYRALDRMRLLAETAAATGTGPAERARLDTAFQKGLADLRDFLADAPRDRLALAFGKAGRRAESIGIAIAASSGTTGATLAAARTAPLAGLTGQERFRIDLSRSGAGPAGSGDSVTVDLAGGPQPPTIDSVVAAANAAIAAVPMRDAGGDPVRDADGNIVPKYRVRFAADKLAEGKPGDGWRLKIVTPDPAEQLAIGQIGAADALFVATGLTAAGSAARLDSFRFDNAAASLDRRTGGTLAATDADATAAARLLPAKAGAAPPTIAAGLRVRAMVSDGNGGNFVIGTAAGDIGTERGGSTADLFLARLDDSGGVVWQRSLGAAGTAEGAAMTLAANGDLIVAGQVTGSFDGAATDGDMLVARYTAGGDEVFASPLRRLGAGAATAIATDSQGRILIGGSENGEATLVRLGADGSLQERQAIAGASGVTALATGADGRLVALARGATGARVMTLDAGALATVTATRDLGMVDARALALAPDGRIAVAGATATDLPGAQVNGRGAGHDAFLTLLGADLGSAATTYVGSEGDDGADSIAVMGDSLYLGGRTRGALAAPRSGSVDGFVARIDLATGSAAQVRQFGAAGAEAAPVLVGAAPGGSNALAALGLKRGLQTLPASDRLLAATTLRPGDSFGVRLGTGRMTRIIIAADDTMATLARRIGQSLGDMSVVSAVRAGDRRVLRFEASPARPVTLSAGPEGSDALAGLGLEPARLVAPPAYDAAAPKVQPGGSFGLELGEGLSLADGKLAAASLSRIKSAITTAQVAWRSLWWDDTKARIVDGGRPGLNAQQQAQMAGYQEALGRLSALVASNAATQTLLWDRDDR